MLARATSGGRPGRRGRSAGWCPRLASRGGAGWRRVVYADAVAPDEEFMLELRRRFKPQVVALSEYLERDLVSLWGYDVSTSAPPARLCIGCSN